MKDTLKPYPAYQELNLPWLESIPEHWQIQRGKALFDCIDARSSTGDEELLTVSSDRGVIPRKSATVTMFKAESYEGYKLCWPGDLVINSLWAWAKGLGASEYHGIISSAYGVYRLKPNIQGDINYIHELVRSSPFQWELQVRSKGIWTSRLQLTDDSFLNAPFPIPPPPEQNAIVCYLNYINRRVRRYINAKKNLIALLNEQKQTIIHHVVTRGLDLGVRLKPSGVPWLGDIPENWEVSRVKHEFHCLNKRRIPLSATERGGMSVRQYDYYGASGVIDKVDNYLFDDELLLIAEDGANLVLRNLPLAIIARGKFWVNNHAHVLKPKRGILEYLAEVMESISYKPWISGAAQPKLTEDRLMSIAIAVPSVGEQKRIMATIHDQTECIRTAIARNQREINLLREYHTRLIADVVTGQLDVRKAAARLPEEEEQPEDIEELTDSEGVSEEVALEPAIAEATDDD